MDKLQWFKFSPSSWMIGRIQRCEDALQAKFMRLCCTYWNHGCDLQIEDAEIELGEDGFRELLRLRIIKTDGDYLEISFLDEQFGKIEDVKEKRSEQGAIGNLKRWHKPIYEQYTKGEIDLKTAISIAKGSPPDRPPIAKGSQMIAEKRREEKIREDKKRVFTPPSLNHVIEYFKEKGYTEQSAVKAFEYYSVANWKDSKGNKVKNWKQKMQGVWFKDENKLTPSDYGMILAELKERGLNVEDTPFKNEDIVNQKEKIYLYTHTSKKMGLDKKEYIKKRVDLILENGVL